LFDSFTATEAKTLAPIGLKGPFNIVYINAADDPQRATPTREPGLSRPAITYFRGSTT
jgi:hypothetical protein